MKILLLAILFTLPLLSANSVVSESISKQTEAVNRVKTINANQNNEIKNKIAIKKHKLLELRNSVFLVKQRNELILNYFHLDSLFVKE